MSAQLLKYSMYCLMIILIDSMYSQVMNNLQYN